MQNDIIYFILVMNALHDNLIHRALLNLLFITFYNATLKFSILLNLYCISQFQELIVIQWDKLLLWDSASFTWVLGSIPKTSLLFLYIPRNIRWWLKGWNLLQPCETQPVWVWFPIFWHLNTESMDEISLSLHVCILYIFYHIYVHTHIYAYMYAHNNGRN